MSRTWHARSSPRSRPSCRVTRRSTSAAAPVGRSARSWRCSKDWWAGGWRCSRRPLGAGRSTGPTWSRTGVGRGGCSAGSRPSPSSRGWPAPCVPAAGGWRGRAPPTAPPSWWEREPWADRGEMSRMSVSTAAARPRVLLAGDFPERPPMTVGGIQAVTWQLASGLAESGDFEVHTAACERFWHAPPARNWRCEWGACTAHYRQTPRRIPHVVSSWTSDAEYVRRKIRATGARLVHAHGQVGYTIGALRSGVPHVVTPHGMLLREKHAPEGA